MGYVDLRLWVLVSVQNHFLARSQRDVLTTTWYIYILIIYICFKSSISRSPSMLDTPDDNPKNNQNNQGCLGFMVQWHPMIISLHQWSPRAWFTFLQVHTSSTFQFLRTCLRIFKYLVYTNWLFFIFQMCLINTLSYHVLSVSHICLLKRWIVRIFNAVLETSSIFWLKGTMIISQKMTESFFSHQQITYDNWMNYKNSLFSTMFFWSRQVNRHITPHDCWVALNGKARFHDSWWGSLKNTMGKTRNKQKNVIFYIMIVDAKMFFVK